MRIHRGFGFKRPEGSAPLVAAIGVFDGVHRGHAAILLKTLSRARARRGSAAVITFDRHPLRTLAPHAAPRCLQTLDQRLAAFAAYGFDHALVLPFVSRLSDLSAERFVRQVLVERLALAELVVGYDFHFGRGGKGDARLLSELGRRASFKVHVVPPVLHAGEPVSSTRIRRLASVGRLAEAAHLLGHPYAIAGRRVTGARRGRRLGYPTINVKPLNELLPPRGVYVVRSSLPAVAGVANLGVRPTFTRGKAAPLLEVHVLKGRLERPLPRRLEISLLKFLRPERRFPSVSALTSQIRRDVARTRSAL